MTAGVLYLQQSSPPQHLLLYAAWFVLDLLLIIRFEARTIQQITGYLRIKCFSITKQQ
jgi:hypothetical protein